MRHRIWHFQVGGMGLVAGAVIRRICGEMDIEVIDMGC
jgi:hypothetical protein